VLKIECYL